MLFCVVSMNIKEGGNVTAEEIAIKFTDHENEIKSLKHRMDKREKTDEILIELTTQIKTVSFNVEYIAKEQQKQGERLERLEHEPTDEYKYYKRQIISCIITAVIGAVIGAVLVNVI